MLNVQSEAMNFRLFRHLWLFLAVAEERHFGRAARRLGMSQPPLTQQIQVLEHELGVRLFERSPHGTQLTEQGKAILPVVRKFAEQAQRLEGAVQEARMGRSGFLVIGAIQSAIIDLLPSIMDEMTRKFPALSLSVVEIDSCTAEDGLLAGDIDVAFARLDADRGDIKVRPISRDRVIVALPDGHALAGAEAVDLAALATEDMVWFPRPLSPNYFDSLVGACRAAGFSPRIRHEVRGMASQLAFVNCRQGVALVTSEARRLCLAHAVLRPLVQEVDVVTVAVAWRAGRESPAVEEIARLATAAPQRAP